MKNALRPEFYTISEFASVMKMGRHQASRLVSAGRIPCVRLGRNTVRIPRAVVDTLIDGSLPPVPSRDEE